MPPTPAPTYAVTTFGCQMNVHDSERIEEVLRSAGYAEGASVEDATVLVLNTCSVREKAEQKLRSEVGRVAKLKRARPDLVLVVAGCVAQQEGERLLKTLSGVDVVIGPDNIADLPRLLAEAVLGAPPVVHTVFDLDDPRFLTAHSVSEGSATAFVTTMKGCDERCSFCIVPTTRGPERYRRADEVVAEIARLVERGVGEVTLLGQTVNSYRDPDLAQARAPGADPDESEFPALLRRIAREVPALRRLRYTSPHPRHLTPALMRAHAELAVLPRHVHLPVQSGSDRMLKKMIRRYKRAEYVERTTALRAMVPGLTLSTDVIVGFPGETEADFQETLSLVQEIGFVGLFGFKYSPRPHTPAQKLGDDVTEEVKSDRLARLFELSERLLSDHLATLVGTTQEVLLEGLGKQARKGGPAAYTGRTGRHEIVHVADPRAADLVGEIAEVTITERYKHSLAGALTEAAVACAEASARARGSSDRGGPARRRLPLMARPGVAGG